MPKFPKEEHKKQESPKGSDNSFDIVDNVDDQIQNINQKLD